MAIAVILTVNQSEAFAEHHTPNFTSEDSVVSSERGANAAPSMGGFSFIDSERVYFTGVISQPIFLTTATQIMVIDGKATGQFVGVYMDDQLIETLDMGVTPLGTPHNMFTYFGGVFIEIPFEFNWNVTETGQLEYTGQYNQLRHIDGQGNISYEEFPDNDSVSVSVTEE